MRNVANTEISKTTYDKIKNYFICKNTADCVIEISDKPIPDWKPYFTNSEEQMAFRRGELSRLKKPFVAIYKGSRGKYFFFTDYILTQLEILDTGEILLFDLENIKSDYYDQVRKEFLELKKMLQGT